MKGGWTEREEKRLEENRPRMATELGVELDKRQFSLSFSTLWNFCFFL